MNKRGEKYGLMVLAVVAVVAVIGLVTYFGSGATGAVPYFKSWDTSYETAEEVADKEGFPNVATKLCTEDIIEWASSLEGTKAGKEAAMECGKCCVAAAEEGKISKYNIDICSRTCADKTGETLFRIAD